jgi:hypothetical protein
MHQIIILEANFIGSEDGEDKNKKGNFVFLVPGIHFSRLLPSANS